MKRVAIVVMLALLLVPFIAGAAPEPETTGNPPIEPPLVREGEFAVRLSEALGLATAPAEPEAESKLSSQGIAPGSGWISDYPMTPRVIGELRQALGESAEAGRLAMSKEEAIQHFDNIASEYQLSIAPGTEEAYAGYAEGVEEVPTLDDERFAGESEEIYDYYHEHGPPVLTYYPPPPPYGYLYDWVPYPFFHTSLFFTGFFLLHDFHRPVKNVFIINNRRSLDNVAVISNRRFDPNTGRFSIVSARDRFGAIAAARAQSIRDRRLAAGGGIVGNRGELRNRLDLGARRSAQTILRQDTTRQAALGRSNRINGNTLAEARALARENRQRLNTNARTLLNDRIVREGRGGIANRIGQERRGTRLGGEAQSTLRARRGIGESGPGSRIMARDRDFAGRAQRLNNGRVQRFGSQRQDSIAANRLNRRGVASRSFQPAVPRSGTTFRSAPLGNRGTTSFRPGGRSFAPRGTAFRSGGFRAGRPSFRTGGGLRTGGSFRSGGGARFGGGGFRGGGGGFRGGGRGRR